MFTDLTPRVYVPSRGAKALRVLLALLVAFPAVFLAVWGVIDRSVDWFSWTVISALLLWAVYYLYSIRAWAILLYPDRVETYELGKHRVLPLEDIEAYRILSDRLLFTLRDGRPDFRIRLLFPLDASWRQWLHQITNLDGDDPLDWDTEE